MGFLQLISLKLNIVPFFYFIVWRLVDWNWPAVGNVAGGADATVNVAVSLPV